MNYRYVIHDCNNINIFRDCIFLLYCDADEYVKSKNVKDYRICMYHNSTPRKFKILFSTYKFDKINDIYESEVEKCKVKYNHKMIIDDLKLNGVNCEKHVHLCDYFPFSGKFIYRLNGVDKNYLMNILINKLGAEVKDMGLELIFELKKIKYKMEKKIKKIEDDSSSEIDGVFEDEIEYEFDDDFYNDDYFDEDDDSNDKKLEDDESVNFDF